MSLSFYKLSGAGNDFVLLASPVKSPSAFARMLCDRRSGVGADGLVILSRKPKLKLSYFNADGSEAFCGNGTRCAAWWMKRQGWVKSKEFSFETAQGPVTARITGANSAAIRMPEPRVLGKDVKLAVRGLKFTAQWLDTGVPHAVIFVEHLEDFPVVEVGRAVRRHPAFGRPGANADFVASGKAGLAVRTYERGVENETMACGTGAVASAVAAFLLGRAEPPVTVRVRSGDSLTVRFSAAVKDVWLEGPSRLVFEGRLS